jgi:intein-encoded DNA endonuclease-like protein
MVVSSTCYPCKEIHMKTWRSPDVKVSNQIEHTLMDKLSISSKLDVKSEAQREAKSNSDYFLAKEKYRYKIAHRNNEINRNPKIYNTERLKETSITTEYQQQLRK